MITFKIQFYAKEYVFMHLKCDASLLKSPIETDWKH